MKLLKFERINQLIVVAAQGKNPNYLEKFKTSSDELKITFSEYVKSQLHVNVVTDLLNRNIYDYLYAYQFLEGNVYEIEATFKVIRYFYEDMLHFLINNTEDMKLDLSLEFSDNLRNFLGITKIKQFNEYTEIFDFFRSIINCSDSQQLFKIVSGSKFSFIIDSICDIDDLKNKMCSYVLATAISLYLDTEISSDNLVEFLEVPYEDES